MRSTPVVTFLLATTTAHLSFREGLRAFESPVSQALLSCTLCALNLIVTLLLLVRSRALSRIRFRGVLSTLMPVVLSGALLACTRKSVGIVPALTFLAGGLIAAFALLNLGRSFAFVPAKRRLKTRGLYQVVRHPAYAGELIMSASLLFGAPSRASLVLFVGAFAATLVRIKEEERVLASPCYARYKRRSRFVLIPGLL